MDIDKVKTQSADVVRAVREAIAKDPEKGKSSYEVRQGAIAYAREKKYADFMHAMTNGGLQIVYTPGEPFGVKMIDKVLTALE